MIPTPLTRLLGIRNPVIQAGMAVGYTSPELVAAVSESGGLGILGCLDRPADDAISAIRRIRAATDRPFGVNFVLHRLDARTFDACLAERVPVFSFFRGDDQREAVTRAKAVGAGTIHQVTTVVEAERAVSAGVDVLVAQGREAGGHTGAVPLSALVSDVVRVAAGRPVVAAGGIVDGTGLAAALALGVEGVLMGTRFLATPESPASQGHKDAIVRAGANATVVSDRLDLVWGEDRWPGVGVRFLRNRFAQAVLAMSDDEFDRSLPDIRARYLAAKAADDVDGRPLLAGMGAGRIASVEPAAQVVQRVVAEAEAVLQGLAGRIVR